MAALTLDGRAVLHGVVQLPFRGVWCADIAIDGTDPVAAGAHSLRFADLPEMPCTLVSAPPAFGPSQAVRVIGGKGGWRTTLPPRSYRSPLGVRFANIIADLARECGETVDMTTAPSGTIGEHFIRSLGRASDAMNRVAPQWWVRRDGVTSASTRAVATAPTPGVHVLDYRGTQWVTCATDVPGILNPGDLFEHPTLSGRVASVAHTIGELGQFSLVWLP